MGGCGFGLRSQFSAEPGNEQATDTLPCASSAMARICFWRGSCASADIAERVKRSARRIWLSIGTPATPGNDDACSVHNSGSMRPLRLQNVTGTEASNKTVSCLANDYRDSFL